MKVYTISFALRVILILEMRSQQVFTCKLRACVPLKTTEIKMSYKFSSFPSGNGCSEGMSDQEPLK